MIASRSRQSKVVLGNFEQDFTVLRPLREAAELIAVKADWPVLYNTDVLQKISLPVASASYYSVRTMPAVSSLNHSIVMLEFFALRIAVVASFGVASCRTCMWISTRHRKLQSM